MRLASYVRKHSATGIFWYRRAIPPHLRGAVPEVPGFAHNPARVEFSKTLRTRDMAEANRAAARIDGSVQKALEAAEQASQGVTAPLTEALTPPESVRIKPQDALAAIERWRTQEIAYAEQRIFNGDESLSAWEAAVREPDAQYCLQQFVLAGREFPDGWKAVAGFDEVLIKALATVNMTVPAGHPALYWLRRSFAAEWWDILRAIERMRQGLWTWDGADAAPVSPQVTSLATATPLLVSVEEWSKVLPLKDRQKSMYVSDVRQFAAAVSEATVETLTKAQTQAWVTKLLGDGITAKTLRRKLSAIRNYWNFLRANQMADATDQPFEGLWLKGGNNPTRKHQRGERPFAPDEVVQLWRAAVAEGDTELADLIRLAAFTGGRIEALCAIKLDHVRRDQATNIDVIEMADKSQAGRREVPIHEAIQPLIQSLCQKVDLEGFIVPTTARNKYNERSAALGKRFGRLKAKHGFDERYVFHSIRKTVATLFERGECPENIAADILGHDKPTMTFGLYSGGSGLEQRNRWLQSAIRYPSSDFMQGHTRSPHVVSEAITGRPSARRSRRV
jgi:integrase